MKEMIYEERGRREREEGERGKRFRPLYVYIAT
jgi:hypothetical protein